MASVAGFETGAGAELIPLSWQLSATTVHYMLAAGAPAILICVLILHSLQHSADTVSQARFFESRALKFALLLFLAWLPWYPVSVSAKAEAVPVAPAWHLLLRTADALNQLIARGLRVDEDLHRRAAALAAADLEDHPELDSEYADFEDECYLPARRKAASLGLPKEFASWAGARTLSQTPGFYAPCGDSTSAACERGFFSPLQSVFPGSQDQSISCNQWWQGNAEGKGLKERLLGALRQDAASVWDGKLSADDAEAWLRSYLLRSDSRLGLIAGLWDKARSFLGGSGSGESLYTAALSRLGSAALVWKLGAEGVLLLHLLLGIVPQIQILLLSLLALLWPAIAVLSGFNTATLLRTALAYALIKLWTALRALGSFMHEVVWRLAAGQDTGIASLAVNFTDARQLLLWYVAASLPWLVPLVGSWLIWKLVTAPASGSS